MVNILIVEDDNLFRETLCDFFEDEGFCVTDVADPLNALDLIYNRNFDLYIFDIKLPFESGLKLLNNLRDSGDKTPTIVLTSYSDRENLLNSFKLGADDFLTKPVDLEELKLRVDAILNRSGIYKEFKLNNLIIYPNSLKIEYMGKEYILPKKIFELLKLLIEAKGGVVKFETIESRLWSHSQEASYIAIRIYITKLKKIFGSKIKNIRGMGYKLEL